MGGQTLGLYKVTSTRAKRRECLVWPGRKRSEVVMSVFGHVGVLELLRTGANP
jgi:hypothetical protein